MKPDTSIPSEELFMKLLEAPSPSEVVDFPRRGQDGKPVARVRIFVLSMADHHWARLEAGKWLRAQGLENNLDNALSPVVREIYGDATARFLLQRAVRTEHPIKDSEHTAGGAKYAYVFPDAASIDRVLTAPELAVLFGAYMAVQHKYGPTEELVESDAELSAWVKRLTEGASALPFLRLGSHGVERLCLLLARRVSSICALLESQWASLPPSLAAALERYRMVSGYAGSQPPSSTTSESSTSRSGGDPITLDEAAAYARRMRDG